MEYLAFLETYKYLKRHWLLRLPIVRNVRAGWFGFNCDRHYQAWRSVFGMGQWSLEEVYFHRAILEGNL